MPTNIRDYLTKAPPPIDPNQTAARYEQTFSRLAGIGSTIAAGIKSRKDREERVTEAERKQANADRSYGLLDRQFSRTQSRDEIADARYVQEREEAQAAVAAEAAEETKLAQQKASLEFKMANSEEESMSARTQLEQLGVSVSEGEEPLPIRDQVVGEQLQLPFALATELGRPDVGVYPRTVLRTPDGEEILSYDPVEYQEIRDTAGSDWELEHGDTWQDDLIGDNIRQMMPSALANANGDKKEALKFLVAEEAEQRKAWEAAQNRRAAKERAAIMALQKNEELTLAQRINVQKAYSAALTQRVAKSGYGKHQQLLARAARARKLLESGNVKSVEDGFKDIFKIIDEGVLLKNEKRELPGILNLRDQLDLWYSKNLQGILDGTPASIPPELVQRMLDALPYYERGANGALDTIFQKEMHVVGSFEYEDQNTGHADGMRLQFPERYNRAIKMGDTDDEIADMLDEDF